MAGFFLLGVVALAGLNPAHELVKRVLESPPSEVAVVPLEDAGLDERADRPGVRHRDDNAPVEQPIANLRNAKESSRLLVHMLVHKVLSKGVARGKKYTISAAKNSGGISAKAAKPTFRG
jgi:hypothetical protein